MPGAAQALDLGGHHRLGDPRIISRTPLISRDRAGIARFLEGFILVEPGLVAPAQWRPDLHDPLRDGHGQAPAGVHTLVVNGEIVYDQAATPAHGQAGY